MKQLLILLGFAISLTLHAQVVISEKADDRFGGFWLDVNKSQGAWTRAVGVGEVLTIQKLMRDCLLARSGSHFRVKQQAHLNACVQAASEKVKKVRIQDTTRGLRVVFDMDETLLTQWHRISLENPRRTTLVVRNTDYTMSEAKSEVTFAPRGVTIRPGIYKLLHDLAADGRIGNIYFFSARSDVSAEELTQYILTKVPALRRKFGGLLARNHLRLDREPPTPSKDLRIIAPDLRNIILIDDNISRVMQKNLNFTIPKFNADLYLDAVAKQDRTVIEANNLIVSFTSALILKVASGANFSPYSTENSERMKIDWGRKALELAGFSPGVIEELLKQHVFHQEFYAAETVKL